MSNDDKHVKIQQIRKIDGLVKGLVYGGIAAAMLLWYMAPMVAIPYLLGAMSYLLAWLFFGSYNVLARFYNKVAISAVLDGTIDPDDCLNEGHDEED